MRRVETLASIEVYPVEVELQAAISQLTIDFSTYDLASIRQDLVRTNASPLDPIDEAVRKIQRSLYGVASPRTLAKTFDSCCCAACGEEVDKSAYTKAQLRKSPLERRCKVCVDKHIQLSLIHI